MRRLDFAHTKTKAQISFAEMYCKADQCLCFRYTDSTVPLLSKSKISSFKPSSVTVQPGLCRTRFETPRLRKKHRGSFNTQTGYPDVLM